MVRNFYYLMTVFILILLVGCQPIEESSTLTMAADTGIPSPSATLAPSASATATLIPAEPSEPSSTPTPEDAQVWTATPPTYVRENTPIPQPENAISATNAGRVVELARLGKGAVQDVQLTPNRQYLIVQTTMGVYGYDADLYDQLWQYEDPTGLAAMTLPRLSRWMAVANNDAEIALLIYQRGAMFTRWASGQNAIYDLAFSYDGALLAAIGDLGVTVWQVGQTKPLYHYPEMAGEAVRFTPDGESLIVSGVDLARFYGLETGELSETVHAENYWPFPSGGFRPLTFSYDGKYFSDGKSIWDGETGAFLFQLFDGEVDDTAYVTFSRDSQYLALSIVYDGEISIWRVSDGTMITGLDSPYNTFGGSPFESGNQGKRAAPAKMSGDYSPYYLDLSFSPDGTKLAATTSEGQIEIWGWYAQRLEERIPAMGSELVYRKASRLVVYGENSLQQVDLNKGTVIRTLRDFTSQRYDPFFVQAAYSERKLNFSPDGAWLFYENTVWRLPEGARAFRLGEEAVLGVSTQGDVLYTFDNATDIVRTRRLDGFGVENEVTLSIPGSLYLEEYLNNKGRLTLFSLVGSPASALMTGYVYDYGLFTWDMRSGAEIEALYIFSWAGLYAPQGAVLLVNGENRINALSVPSGEILFHIEGVISNVTKSCVFSPDGKYLLVLQDGIEKYTIGEDYTVAIQDVLDLDGAAMQVDKMSVSPNNQVIALASGQALVLLDFETGEILARLPAHLEGITDMAFSSDGRTLATASTDGTIKLWGIP